MATTAYKFNRRTAGLLLVAAFLGVLIAYDYREPDSTASTPVSKRSSAMTDEWRSILASRESIERTYAEAAIPYAEMAANLWTFVAPGDPRAALRVALGENLPADSEVVELLIGEPEAIGEGVYALDVRLRIASEHTKSVFEILWGLGAAGHGLYWKSFSVRSDPDKPSIDIHGELSAVVVQGLE